MSDSIGNKIATLLILAVFGGGLRARVDYAR